MICLSVASGLIVRPSFKEFFLMYTHTFFVTSVRGKVIAPQTAANASLSFFGAKMPTPFFFIMAAFFLPVALCAALPIFRFSTLVFLSSAFVSFVFVTTVAAGVVFVVVVIAIRRAELHARTEP